MKKLHSGLQPLSTALLAALLALGGCASPPARQQPASPVAAAAVDTAPAAADEPRLLSLQGAANVRHFDNLKGKRGPIPAGAFVRAADLYRLTPADRDKLAAAGVKLDVDLRTGGEASTNHDVLADDARFTYVRISLMGTEQIDMSKLPDTLGEMYVQSLAANQAQFRDVFQAMAAQQDGTVLFHCTAGKDRTGMIAATLLSLAGVPRRDIVHDYAISAHYLGPSLGNNPAMAEMVRQNPQLGAKLSALAGSEPGNMEAFLDALDGKYGGARAYLKTIGVSDTEVQSLLVRLGQIR
jgi:protein-tyrosine phosphatase